MNAVAALSSEDEGEAPRGEGEQEQEQFEDLFDVRCRVTRSHYCRGCVYEAEPVKTAAWFHFLWPER